MMYRGWTGRSGALSMTQKMVRFIFQVLKWPLHAPSPAGDLQGHSIIRDNLLPSQDFDSETQTQTLLFIETDSTKAESRNNKPLETKWKHPECSSRGQDFIPEWHRGARTPGFDIKLDFHCNSATFP